MNTPRVRSAFVENFSDAPRAQDNLSKLLTALSAITAPSAGTLQNWCTFLGIVPALGAAMAESALSNTPRVRRAFVDLGTVLLNINTYIY